MTNFFAPVVYLLCFLTSSVCAGMLAYNFQRTGARLLLWSAICFVLLAANNMVLVFDLLIFPAIDLHLLRQILSLSAVSALIFGFIWNTDEE